MSNLEGKMNILSTLQDMVNKIDDDLELLEEFTTEPNRSKYTNIQNEAQYFSVWVNDIKTSVYKFDEAIDEGDGRGYKTLLKLVIRPEIKRQKKRLKKAVWAERTRWSNLV